MLLAPVSDISVSDMARLGGADLQLGREVKVLLSREDLSLLFLEIIKLVFKADPHRQAKLSQPFFLVAPGPARLAWVAVSTCPGALFLQELLEWRWLTPHLWEEQNPPMFRRFFISAGLSSRVVWSLVAPAPVLGDLGLGEEEESFISVSNFLMASYCFEVMAVRRELASVSWKSVRPLLVAASAILSRSPSRAWRAKSPAGVVAVADAV